MTSRDPVTTASQTLPYFYKIWRHWRAFIERLLIDTKQMLTIRRCTNDFAVIDGTDETVLSGFPLLSAVSNRNVSIRYRPINRFLYASVRGSTRTEHSTRLILLVLDTPYPPSRNFSHRIWTNLVTRSGWGWGGTCPLCTRGYATVCIWVAGKTV